MSGIGVLDSDLADVSSLKGLVSVITELSSSPSVLTVKLMF